MILKRWSWLIVLPLALAAGIAVFRLAYLERDVRHELADELSGPLEAARIEVEHWNRFREMAGVSGTSDKFTITDSTFSSLNATHRIEESRTTLLARRGDSVVVLSSGSRDSVRLPSRVFSFKSVNKQIRAAFTDRRKGGGTGQGLAYDGAYSAVPVRGTDWVLFREVEGPSLVERLLLPFAIDVAFIASLVLFGFAYVRSRVRETTLRREQALSEVRADFLAAVSHELKTPLAQIRMFAELLRSGAMRKPDEMSRALNVIEKESNRLSILVDNVLNYARLRRESSPVSADISHGTDVKRDIDYVMDAFAPLAREKEVTLTSSAADSVPFANVDSEAVRQILLNFLENAVKYGPRGQTVAIGARQHGAGVQVWVDDQGPGVSPTEREFIWTAFRRGKAGSESQIGGAGIGLSVVHDLVKKFAGKVWVEDSPTGGARFIVEFAAVTVNAR